MFCPKCGKEIKDDALFCPNCGNKISEEKKGDDIQLDQSQENTQLNQIQKFMKTPNNKTLIYIGVGVIALLLIIVLILVINGGKKEETTSDNTEISSNEDSVLKDIMGDWEKSGTINAGSTFDLPRYLKIEEEGMTATSIEETVIFSKPVRSIEIEEKDGVKYYTLKNIEMNLNSNLGDQTFDITYYYDSSEELLICEFSEYGEVAKYKKIESIDDSELSKYGDGSYTSWYEAINGELDDLVAQTDFTDNDLRERARNMLESTIEKEIESKLKDGLITQSEYDDLQQRVSEIETYISTGVGPDTSSTNTPSATYDYTQELDDFLAGVIDMEDAARSDTSIAEEWAENQSIAQEILDEEIKPALENDLQNGAISQSEYDTFQEKITEIESHLSTNNVTSTDSDSTENSTGSSSDITPDEGDSYTGGY